ncbi:MAG TPA: DUF1761 domain-containing protein [Spirochaetota bacterium]|nr:DUF1761 domain-containing protein [Spirochaetota bacterium]
MLEADINHLAVLASAIVSMAIGAVWYSPFIFGKIWMAQSGLRPEDMKGKGRAMAIAAVSALAASYVLAHFVDILDARSLQRGLAVAFWIWLGFVATVMALEMGFAGKSFKAYLIDTGNQLASFLAMGAILSVWR